MDWPELFDWFNWCLLAFVFVVSLVSAIMFLAIGVYLVVRLVRGDFNKPPPPPPYSIEELLASIPDVPYQALPAAADDDGDEEKEDAAGVDDDSCAICVTPYEAGEACSVLPGCTHMFHKPCVASWLRKKNTCPLCRATVYAVAVPPRQDAGNPVLVLNAAENMV